ncbi:MAG: ATP-dependent Clp protease adaptor ClpS [Pseudomonadota bacterium]
METIQTQSVSTTPELQQPRLQTLVLHNHDGVSFQEVWAVLCRVFNFHIQDIRMIARAAHNAGSADLYTAVPDIIESKLAACIKASRLEGCPQLPFSVRDV